MTEELQKNASKIEKNVMNAERFKGCSKCWVKTRDSGCLFALNKLVSMGIAFGLAYYTLSLKPLLLEYARDYPEADNLSDYRVIYWLLFIYYAF